MRGERGVAGGQGGQGPPGPQGPQGPAGPAGQSAELQTAERMIERDPETVLAVGPGERIAWIEVWVENRTAGGWTPANANLLVDPDSRTIAIGNAVGSRVRIRAGVVAGQGRGEPTDPERRP